MLRKFFSAFIALLFFISAHAQIDADRPDQTESAVNTPKKYFQAEFGFDKENYGGMNYNLSHPSFLFKYGISTRIEMRVEGGFQSDYVHLIPNPRFTTSFGPVEVGTRIGLFEQKGVRPKTAFLLHFGLPFTSTAVHDGQKIYPSFRLCFQNSLTDHVALGYNVGAAWDGYDNTPTWLYTFAPGFDIGKRGYAFVEVFGFIQSGAEPQHLVDAGLAFDISNNTRIDFSAGKGISNTALKNFVALGFSFRVPTGKRVSN